MKIDITRDSFRREKHYHDVRMQQGRVQTDADQNEQADILAYLRETGVRDIIGECGFPADNPGFGISRDGKGGLKIGRGHGYIDGILVENDDDDAKIISDPESLGSVLLEKVDYENSEVVPFIPCLAYLDVWEHPVTVLDDPDIREVALPCPDTSARMKTVWQVKLKQIDRKYTDCTEALMQDIRDGESSTGLLDARGSKDTTPADPCKITSAGGYRLPENHLYRVEIHRGGTPGTATFKWSRDNGAVAVLWNPPKDFQLKDGAELFVSNPGGSAATGFVPGDWVEITDEKRELGRIPGYFARLSAVDGNRFTVNKIVDENDDPVSIDAGKFTNPKIRHWDSCGAKTVKIPPDTEGWIQLADDGIEIRFSDGGKYRTGDYWLIPARTVLPESIIWNPPAGESGNGTAQLPHGPLHHFCALAICRRWFPDRWDIDTDCRKLFGPLSCRAIHITGIGLEDQIHDNIKNKVNKTDRLNDTNVNINNFTHGFYLLFDRPVDLATLLPSVTFSVMADINGGFASQTVSLDGTIDPDVTHTKALWKPVSDAARYFEEHLAKNEDQKFLIRVALKGTIIRGLYNRSLYLDGEAFGITETVTGRTALQLPSGNNQKNSDFYMWFWLGRCKVKAEVSKDSVVRSKPFSVTIIGVKNHKYRLNFDNAGGGIAPTIDKQTGVEIIPSNPPVAIVTIDETGYRKVSFSTSSDSSAGKPEGTTPGAWTISVVDEADKRCQNTTVIKVEKGAVTVGAAGDQSYYLGEEIKLSGINTESYKTFLFLTGPNLHVNGANISDPGTSPSKDNDAGTFKAVDVLGDNTWSWKWGTKGYKLDAGTYTVYAVSNPLTKASLAQAAYGTVSILIKKPVVIVTPAISQPVFNRGETVVISGTAPASGKVYLSLSRADSPDVQTKLTALNKKTEDGNSGSFDVAGTGPDGTFEFTWNTAKLKNKLSPGKYLVHVVTTPKTGGSESNAEHAAIPIEITKSD